MREVLIVSPRFPPINAADVHRVRTSLAYYRRFGWLSYRSLLPLYRAGSRLFRERRYDVVFFSTTVFMSFVLGRLWKRRFGCKIVYDFQDPWYSDPPIYTR